MKRKLRDLHNRHFRKKTAPVFNQVEKILGILGSIASIISIFDFGVNINTKNVLHEITQEIKSLGTIWGIIFIIGITIFAIKYRSLGIIKMNASAIGLSSVMDNTLRFIDKINDIDKLTSAQCDGCQDVKNLRLELLNTLFVRYTISFLDKIVEVMSSYVNYNVSACIKLVVDMPLEGEGSINIDNIDDKGIVTLARSSDSNEKRNKVTKTEPVSIKSNSDFYDIISGTSRDRAPYFYVQDLRTYSKLIEELSNGQHIYNNSTFNWWEHYIGTVVVPIGNITSQGKMDNYRIWGFLCVDSMSDKAFSKSQKDINVKMLQGYASIYSIAYKEYVKKQELQ